MSSCISFFQLFFTVRNTDQASHIILSCNNWAEGSFGVRGFVLEMSLISTSVNIKSLHRAVGSPMNSLYGGLVRDSYKPIRLTQCCTQFKSPGVKLDSLCIVFAL